MSERNKEALSAFLDGEAHEVEVHRLLREFRDDKALKSSWAAWRQAGAGARGKRLTQAQHLALYDRIKAAVAAEPPHGGSRAADAKPGLSARRFLPARLSSTPRAALAAAASVLLAVALGFAFLLPDAGPEAPALAAAGAGDAPTLELTELDEDKQRRLRNYLNQHRRMSQMQAAARNVAFNNSQPQARGNNQPQARSSSQPRATPPAWRVAWLPKGFRPLGASGNRRHYSDGIATFSVFVERAGAHEVRGSLPEAAADGALVVVTHQPRQARHRVMVVGNVPARTARRIARSVELPPR